MKMHNLMNEPKFQDKSVKREYNISDPELRALLKKYDDALEKTEAKIEKYKQVRQQGAAVESVGSIIATILFAGVAAALATFLL